MAKGKSRRKRQARLKQLAGESELPPPPTKKEANALPSSLRNLIALQKHIENEEFSKSKKKKNNEVLESDVTEIQKEKNSKGNHETKKKKESNGKNAKSLEESEENSTEANEDGDEKKKKKRKLTEMDEIDGSTFENMKPIKYITKTLEKRKRFLKDLKTRSKNNKQSAKSSNGDEDELYKKEIVKFGEIVNEPPQLVTKHYDKKMNASAQTNPHHWPQSIGDQAVSLERTRLNAIKSYRVRKNRSTNAAILLKPPPVFNTNLT